MYLRESYREHLEAPSRWIRQHYAIHPVLIALFVPSNLCNSSKGLPLRLSLFWLFLHSFILKACLSPVFVFCVCVCFSLGMCFCLGLCLPSVESMFQTLSPSHDDSDSSKLCQCSSGRGYVVPVWYFIRGLISSGVSYQCPDKGRKLNLQNNFSDWLE